METMCLGGWSETADADEDVQRICDKVKRQVEEQANNKYAEFTAVKYKSQTVNGYNYLIKVHVGGADYIHVFLFQGRRDDPHPELRNVQPHKTKDDLL